MITIRRARPGSSHAREAFGRSAQASWILKLYELGLTAGCGPAKFCADAPVTRGQMAVFLVRARLGPSADATFAYPSSPLFTDVPATHPYFKWIQRLGKDQITAGCGTGSAFCPNEPVTRAEMAILIMRAAFNQLLPAGTPILTITNPVNAAQGQTVTASLTAVSTNFVQGVTQVAAGPGVTVGSVTVTSPTTLSATLTPASSASLGLRRFIATTGAEEAVLPNGLTIIAP